VYCLRHARVLGRVVRNRALGELMSINPAFFCYVSQNEVRSLARPTAVFIPGQNSLHPEFQAVRELGGEVYPYLNVVEYKIRGVLDEDFVEFVGGSVPLWGNGRQSVYSYNAEPTPLANIRVGTAYARAAVEFIIERFVRSRLYDGVFLDSLGGQLWSASSWTTWPAAERAEWSAGCVDFVRMLRAAVDQVDPSFIIVNNNVWRDNSDGEQYVNGVCIENPPLGAGAWHRAYCQRPFGRPERRRVILIARNEADAKLWATLPGFTHITAVDKSLGQNYKTPAPAVVGYTDLRPLEWRAERARLIAERDAALTQLREANLSKESLQTTVDSLRATVRQIGEAVAELVEEAL
jgi:hypothetical protein